MNPPCVDLAKWLATNGGASLGSYGGAEDFALYAATEPADPDDVVTVYDTGGSGPDTDDLSPANVTFQVRVRCVRYSNGYAVHEIIRDLLLEAASLVCETSTFVGVAMTTDVVGIGRDGNERFLLTANYAAIRNI